MHKYSQMMPYASEREPKNRAVEQDATEVAIKSFEGPTC